MPVSPLERLEEDDVGAVEVDAGSAAEEDYLLHVYTQELGCDVLILLAASSIQHIAARRRQQGGPPIQLLLHPIPLSLLWEDNISSLSREWLLKNSGFA